MITIRSVLERNDGVAVLLCQYLTPEIIFVLHLVKCEKKERDFTFMASQFDRVNLRSGNVCFNSQNSR